MVDAMFTEITGIIDFLITSFQLGVGILFIIALPFMVMGVIYGTITVIEVICVALGNTEIAQREYE